MTASGASTSAVRTWTGAEGVPLVGETWGPADARPVVLLPGGGQTRHSWRATAQRLAQAGYQAIALDLRGHGESGWSPGGRYEQAWFTEDLQRVCDTLGGNRPVLMGASMGGNTCLAAAGEGRVDAAALVLVDIVPATERAGFDRVHTFMTSHPEGFATLEEVAQAIAEFRADGRRPRTGDSLRRAVRKGDDGRFHWHWDPRFMDARRADFESRRERLAALASQLTIPTLLLRGAGSDVVSEDGVRAFKALVPHAEVVNIAGAGHMITADGNDVFGHATLDFLRRHAPAHGAAPHP